MPHCPSTQPALVPVSPSELRSAYRSGWSGIPAVQGRGSTVDAAGIGRHGLTHLTRSRRAERSHTPSRRSYTVTADGQRFVIDSILVPLEPWR